MSMTNGVLTLLPAPKGYIVDFDNPQRNGGLALFLVFGIGLVLSVLFACQHFYIKLIKQRKWLDPAALCLAACFIMSVACQAMVVQWYREKLLGLHAWEMPLDRFIEFLRSFLTVAVIFNAVHCTGKLSILFNYRALSQQKWWQWLVHAGMVIVFVYCTTLFFTLLFACTPMEKAWDVTIVTGSCLDRQAIWLATAILGFLTDFMLLSMPLPLIVHLQMRTAQKIGVLFMLMIGSATFITSIVRLYLLLQPAFASPDQTWDIMTTILWAMVEMNLLVICPSMITLPAFGRYIAPSFFGSSFSKGSVPPNSRATPRTIGQIEMPRRFDKYGQIIEESGGFELNRFGQKDTVEITIEGKGGRSNNRSAKRGNSPDSSDTDAHNRTWDARSMGPQDAEHAIIQTTTISVAESWQKGN